MGKISEIIPVQRIYLDANVFIYYIRGISALCSSVN